MGGCYGVNGMKKSDKKINASDCKCVDCDKPAVAFWPMVDPDIPHYPFCRECLDKNKMDLLIKLSTANSTRGRKS